MFELNCSYVIHSNVIQIVIYSLNISNGLGIKNLKIAYSIFGAFVSFADHSR